MKKCLMAAVALIASATVVFGQMSSKDYDFNNFRVINVSGDFQLELQKGANYAVHISVTEGYLPYVIVNQEGPALNFGIDEKSLPIELRKSLFSRTKSEFKAVVCVPDGTIDAIYLSGKSVLSSGDNFTSDSFVASLTDGASISKLTLKCERAEIRLDKKADASIAVDCNDLIVSQSSTSDLILTHKSKNSSVDLAAASSIVMNGSSEYLSVTSKGSSKSEMSGNVKNALFKCSGSSSLNARNLQCGTLEVELSGFCNTEAKVGEKLTLTLSGGSSLAFAGDPVVEIKSIKNSNVSRLE